MTNIQDAENKRKIAKSIDDLTSQSQNKLKDELEQGAAVLLQRQMNNAKRETTNNISNDTTAPLTLDDQKKKNIKDRSIRQTLPENLAETQSAPDNIYRPKKQKQPEPRDIFAEEKSRGTTRDPDFVSGKDEPKAPTKIAPEKGEIAEEEAPKTNEEAIAPDKTPEWQKQEPTTSEGGMARADTGDISQKKKPEEKKQTPGQEQQKQEEKQRKELHRQKLLERQKKAKEKKEKKAAEEKKGAERRTEQNIGKMTPLSFGLWLFLAIMTDILSLIPYVGLIFSWPFVIVFAIYKWHIKIKKELAIATTAIDFFFEGLLSTLPVNTVDVILTFILSNSTITRAITKRISPAISAKK